MRKAITTSITIMLGIVLFPASHLPRGGAAVGKSPLMPSMGAAMKDNDIQDVFAFLRSLAK